MNLNCRNSLCSNHADLITSDAHARLDGVAAIEGASPSVTQLPIESTMAALQVNKGCVDERVVRDHLHGDRHSHVEQAHGHRRGETPCLWGDVDTGGEIHDDSKGF